MTRKPPYRHKVRPHYRDGKWIDSYKRGEGEEPKSSPKMRGGGRRVGSVYQVVFLFPDGSTEQYNHSGTATGALKAALGDIQRPMIPKRATLRMLGGK